MDNQINFKLSNKREHYTSIYKDYKKSYLRRDTWLMYGALTVVLLVITATYLSFNKPLEKKAFGLIATTAFVISIVVVGRLATLIKADNEINRFINSMEAKGSADVIMNTIGVKLTYANQIEMVNWRDVSRFLFNDTHIELYNSNQDIILLIPKGDIESTQWIAIQECIASITHQLWDNSRKS